MHELFSPMLVGRSPLEIERHWQDMFELMELSGYGGAELRAISAIDMALWDIAGQVAQQPIYNLLGGVLQIESRPGEGAAVRFTIPLAEGDADG